jgi:hypothetical protein
MFKRINHMQWRAGFKKRGTLLVPGSSFKKNATRFNKLFFNKSYKKL